ncbi:hypothetical protein [Chryseolinea soli]|uniref:Uncharacterized protein n=1 Tax=Chryseolinea soli TaxID=2321403 RepID=A0A385SPK6_9BACT|nr:hypothetical protein [Chryseolinea soli]AYB32944.1 hypothetical protein D4L85_21225 [Chryseolinea soli]
MVDETKAVIALTDNGRALKKSGSLLEYNTQILNEKIAKLELKSREKQTHKLTIWVAVSTIVMAILALIQIAQIICKLFPRCSL